MASSIWGFLAFGVLGFLVGGSLFVGFWALVGQTPGMRLLSIHLDADGTREIGLRRAVKRLFAVPLALLPAGMGFFAILLSPDAPRLARPDRGHHGGLRRAGQGGAVVELGKQPVAGCDDHLNR